MAIFHEAEAHVRVPVKIAIALHAQPFVLPAQAGELSSLVRRSLSTQRRSAEPTRPSPLATDPIDRPLDTTSSGPWCSSVNELTLVFHSTPPGSTPRLQVPTHSGEVQSFTIGCHRDQLPGLGVGAVHTTRGRYDPEARSSFAAATPFEPSQRNLLGSLSCRPDRHMERRRRSTTNACHAGDVIVCQVRSQSARPCRLCATDRSSGSNSSVARMAAEIGLSACWNASFLASISPTL